MVVYVTELSHEKKWDTMVQIPPLPTTGVAVSIDLTYKYWDFLCYQLVIYKSKGHLIPGAHL